MKHYKTNMDKKDIVVGDTKFNQFCIKGLKKLMSY